ncbi:MAG TPA: efflux RND transporter periplasmic adaptor subunit [Burkholderiales bacterium]|nr:efflux RND transporter periplasmic adaptor subunit [Burkholderiales bacterium]
MRFRHIRAFGIKRAIAAGILLGAVGFPGLPAFAGPAQGASQQTPGVVTLTNSQLRFISIAPVGQHVFTVDRDAVGTVDFDEDKTVQISPPYPGRITALFAKAGDTVAKGQPLFTIDSPDLLQAESTLLTTEGVLKLTTRVLKRSKQLYEAQGLAQKDYDQAVSDQQAAEAAYKAARDAVRIFGKSETQIDRIISLHRLDANMQVLSPLAGVVTARNAALGTLVQPGSTPVPYAVSNLSTKWLLGNVSEGNMPMMRLGQKADIRLMAYPDRLYQGRITYISAAVDPNTHRGTIRIDVPDPENRLQPQMLATFTVHTGISMRSPAVPYDGVVREGDGTMTVWVTRDRRHFSPRTVKIGLRQQGENQILSGLNPGELVATEGALFISNAYSLEAK